MSKMTKLEKYKQKFGLENLDQQSSEIIQTIMRDNLMNTLGKIGMALSFSKLEEQMKVSYLSALVSQNWILIKQNDKSIRQQDRIIELLELMTEPKQ